MKGIVKKLLTIGGILLLLKNNTTYAKTVQIERHDIETEEANIETERMINITTIQYSKPSSVYDFIDENGNYNAVYTSESNVYWATFDNNMNVVKTIKIPMYFDKSNSLEHMKDLLFNFGNALYYNEHLYIVYGREGTSSSVDGFNDVTMAIIMYDKNGNIVKSTDLVGTQLNPTNWWNLGGGDWNYGTYLPFYPNSNCSLTVSDGIISCFFGRQMFMPHSSSMIFFIDSDTLEYVNNRYYTSDENIAKYQEPSEYYTSHSMGQRIIGTSDGGYLMAELGDAGVGGSTRGLMISKIYPENNILKISTNKMVHFREGAKGSHGYNNTYSSLGNLIELNDGYMYIGSMEPTLSLEYGNSINESWNIFVQKYTKDFWKKENIKNMQMFNTYVRETDGIAPEDSDLGENASEGRLYLKGNEKDYGIKWLTEFNNEYLTVLVRAVKMENEKIAILYEQIPMKINDLGKYSLDKYNGQVYFFIIDKNANIISNPVYLENAKLNEEELYSYNNGKIYWTTTNGSENKITINVLDVEDCADYIEDINISEDYLKGDLNRDGMINANDSAVALDLYKYNNASDEDIIIGDMDNNGVINANDAALILDVYKYGN